MFISRGLALTKNAALGLFFVQRYRFLTIEQFARAAGMKRAAAADQLRNLENHGMLGHFGNVALQGRGKTPKVCFLKRKGYDFLTRESDIPIELIGPFREANIEATWSPQMFHRLYIVDLMIAAEVGVRERPQLSMLATFTEYRRVKRGNQIARETTDFVDPIQIPENRIVPDGAFIIENVETGKRDLFFVEMDMGNERVVTQITRDTRITLRHKLSQYERYLESGSFAQTYKPWGEYGSFTLLFVTIGDQRIENVRRSLSSLQPNFASNYRFTTYEKAVSDFLGPVWLDPSPMPERHALVH